MVITREATHNLKHIYHSFRKTHTSAYCERFSVNRTQFCLSTYRIYTEWCPVTLLLVSNKDLSADLYARV